MRLVYGHRQRFRARVPDLHILGRVRTAADPLAMATYQVDGGGPHSFSVEPPGGEDVDWRFPSKPPHAAPGVPAEAAAPGAGSSTTWCPSCSRRWM